MEYSVAALRQHAVEHAADVAVATQELDAEKGPRAGPPLAGFERLHIQREDEARQEHDGEGNHAGVRNGRTRASADLQSLNDSTTNPARVIKAAAMLG
ncbi:MAG: hypothetical protein OXN84_14640 [Albidovulum sp.]|nr:hypothetical protein [Albidovulum sp.]